MIQSEEQAQRWIVDLEETDDAAWQRLMLLTRMLEEENSRQNLVSATSLGQVWQRHIVDSAQLLNHVPRGSFSTWLDLGTGAGFPGLVIAALLPDLQMTMVESRAKRIDWLNRAVRQLDLKNAQVVGKRLEQVDSRVCDVISARAFAPLDNLLHMAHRFSTHTTQWLLPKGRSASQELATLSGFHHKFHVEPSVTDPEAGIVVGTLVGRKGSKS